MRFEMEKANRLADGIKGFTAYVNRMYVNKSSICPNSDKVYQVKLFVEEYQFQSLADELLRINMHTWDEKYTMLLVDRFVMGLAVIDEYVNRHLEDLFIFTGRIHSLKNLSSALSGEIRQLNKLKDTSMDGFEQ